MFKRQNMSLDRRRKEPKRDSMHVLQDVLGHLNTVTTRDYAPERVK